MSEIEQMIQEKGLTAPRITPEDIDATIVSEQYYVFPGTTFTVCLLTLKNDYHVEGVSACASLDNFDKEIGEKIAKSKAKEKIWALEGYVLKEQMWLADKLQKMFHKDEIKQTVTIK